ncbi:hypothetical protein FRB99_000879 [Tulasnella sp. 403]|nr:hypothetical protein FRB99_000879 [Tulasnella sp. 403]
MLPPTTFTIPDFIAVCPFPLRINPHYERVSAESEQWFASYGALASANHQKGYQACKFGLLTAMCCPQVDAKRFRLLCDFLNCLYAFDDITDEGNLRMDGDGTRTAADVIRASLVHPEHFDSDLMVGKVFHDFWTRTIEMDCAPGPRRRFIETTDLYLRAVHEQVIMRTTSVVPDTDNYLILRRDAGAVRMCFALSEFGLQLDLPDEFFEHPLVKTMGDCANDIITLTNDVYSYNLEQAQGETCNFVYITMKEKNLDVQRAIEHTADVVRANIELYLDCKRRMPSWGARVDKEAHKYFEVYEDWTVGALYWSLESERYFGKRVQEVRESLRVELLPCCAGGANTAVKAH